MVLTRFMSRVMGYEEIFIRTYRFGQSFSDFITIFFAAAPLAFQANARNIFDYTHEPEVRYDHLNLLAS